MLSQGRCVDAFAGEALEFHLADAPGKAESDGAAAPRIAVVGLVVGVETDIAALFGGEDVLPVEEKREATFQQVGTGSEVKLERGLALAHQRKGGGRIASVGVDLQHLP